MIEQTSTNPASACTTAASRMTPIGEYAEKYDRQITMPDSSSRAMLASSTLNRIFWPPL